MDAWEKLTPEQRAAALDEVRLSGNAHFPDCLGHALIALADHVDPPPVKRDGKRRLHNWVSRGFRSGGSEVCEHCATRRRHAKTKGMPWEYLAPALDPKKATNWTKKRPNCTGRKAAG